jgi:DNA (cytosine-5)-methyltransferase 1
MNYISLFSGIGGLESENHTRTLSCEIDADCRDVIREESLFEVPVHDDVRTLEAPHADAVVGGWPCQDISVAGLRKGLDGERSGLFYEMVRVAVQANAHTIIAENVPNLLTIDGGAAFTAVLAAFHEAGYLSVCWRLLNVREFGLPHSRRRIIIVASKHDEIACAVHRPLPRLVKTPSSMTKPRASGFYWTAGSQSICYSDGFVPTLKVGSGLSIPSPPAVHYGDVVRKISHQEAMSLQGFSRDTGNGLKPGVIHKMAGNAVARPMGRWAVDCLSGCWDEINDRMTQLTSTYKYPPSGCMDEDRVLHSVSNPVVSMANNLHDFLMPTDDRLSVRAASGLLRRLNKSGKPCPADLRLLLENIT